MNPKLSEFSQRYTLAMKEYLVSTDIAQLQPAKELGYLAVERGFNLHDILVIYQISVEKLLPEITSLHPPEKLIQLTNTWLTKTLHSLDKKYNYFQQEHQKISWEHQVMLESLPDSLYSIDKEGNLIRWNRELELATGLNPAVLKNKRILDLFPSEYRFFVAKKIAEVWQTGTAKFDAPFLTLAGPQPYRFKGMLMHSPEGEILGQVYIGRNFGKQQVRDAALRESEERFRLVVENIETIFWLSNPLENKLIYVSPAYEKIFGQSCETLYENPLSFLDFVYEKDRELALANLPLMPTGDYDEEYRIVRANGEICWIRACTFPIKDIHGKIYRVAGFAQDITEQKKQEMILEESISLIRDTLEATADAILVINNEGEVQDFNKNFLEMWEVPEGYIEEKNYQLLLNHAINQVDDQEYFKMILAEQDLNKIGRFRQVIELKNGRILQPFSIPHKLGGKIVGRVLSFQDITERRHAELALLKLNEELEIRVEERTLELQASLKEKEVLLKEIHHRVKNNLQIISSLLKLQSSNIQDERDLSFFQDSYNRVRSMALIHEKLYRTESLARIDTADYIPNLVRDLLSSYGIKGISLNLQISPIYLEIDTAIPCGLIITELVSNSLKYAFPDHRSGEIIVKFRQDKNMILLGVGDNGIGLPVNFDIDQSSSLGLQLVVNLTRQLEGELTIQKEGGTYYLITFMSPLILGEDPE